MVSIITVIIIIPILCKELSKKITEKTAKEISTETIEKSLDSIEFISLDIQDRIANDLSSKINQIPKTCEPELEKLWNTMKSYFATSQEIQQISSKISILSDKIDILSTSTENMSVYVEKIARKFD
jgi:spore cortex formation protein SpoVR/YcgB (stage V sporulation)